MAYHENQSDAKRMEETRVLALTALAKATELADRQGAGFDRQARVAEVAAMMYDADVRRSKEHK